MEALNKLARAGSVRFFVRQKNGKQWNTVCISCFSFCVDGEKDPLSSRRRFIQSFLIYSFPPFIQSRIRPSTDSVTTCQGMIFPLACKAFFTASSSPPQQGTSIRTTVRLAMLLCRRIWVSFSL